MQVDAWFLVRVSNSTASVRPSERRASPSDLFDDIGDIGLRLGTVKLAGLDDGIDGSRALGDLEAGGAELGSSYTEGCLVKKIPMPALLKEVVAYVLSSHGYSERGAF